MPETIKCFGQFGAPEICHSACSYAASCRYFTETEPHIDSGLHMTSFEEISDFNLLAADYDHIPGDDSSPDKKDLLDEIGRFFKFLLILSEKDFSFFASSPSADDWFAYAWEKNVPMSPDDKKIICTIKHSKILSAKFNEVMVKLLSSCKRFLSPQTGTTKNKYKKCRREIPGYQYFFNAADYFFDYLLALDDLTIGIIAEIIDPHTTPCTVSSIGKARGSSRQAVHRKICWIIGKHPELSVMFLPLMYKLPGDRQLQLRKNKGGKR